MTKQNYRNNAIGLIETVLLLALRKGEALRFPSRIGCDASLFWDDFDLNIRMTVEMMDEAGIPWSIQNNALCYVNDADTSSVWNELHSNQLRTIASEICL
jgi:hypothetical protein